MWMEYLVALFHPPGQPDDLGPVAADDILGVGQVVARRLDLFDDLLGRI
jgi:hypothetical protein